MSHRNACWLKIALLAAALSSAATAAQAATKIHWYGQAAFRIETPSGGVILIDPWLKVPTNPDKESIAQLTRVDYILITHGHWDHIGDAIEIAKKTGATLVAPYGLQILWPDHCVQATPGAAFRSDLAIPHAELIVRKGFRREIDSYSAFYENDHKTPTGLAGYLRERGFSRVFVAGLAFDFCVRYSAEDARRIGFDVVVIEEGCRGIDVNNSVADTRAAFKKLDVLLVDAV